MIEVPPSLEDDDFWVRVVTSTDHIKRRKGGLHHTAFTGSAVSPPDDARPWSYEISGRAFSRTTAIQKEAEDHVERIKTRKRDAGQPVSSKLKAAGIGVQSAARLRSTLIDGRIRIDIVHTPKEDDKAHSDMVFYDANEDDILLIQDFLQEQLTRFTPDFIDRLEPRCRT